MSLPCSRQPTWPFCLSLVFSMLINCQGHCVSVILKCPFFIIRPLLPHLLNRWSSRHLSQIKSLNCFSPGDSRDLRSVTWETWIFVLRRKFLSLSPALPFHPFFPVANSHLIFIAAAERTVMNYGPNQIWNIQEINWCIGSRQVVCLLKKLCFLFDYQAKYLQARKMMQFSIRLTMTTTAFCHFDGQITFFPRVLTHNFLNAPIIRQVPEALLFFHFPSLPLPTCSFHSASDTYFTAEWIWLAKCCRHFTFLSPSNDSETERFTRRMKLLKFVRTQVIISWLLTIERMN